MSSYFVNSLSTCYGQTTGLDNCSDGNFYRNVNYPPSGAVYPAFAGARYPYVSKQERLDEQNGDYYGTSRLSHLPPNSPCSSPQNLHSGSHTPQNVHPIHATDRSSCSVRTNSNTGNAFFPNGQMRGGGGLEESRTPPQQHTPPTPTHTQTHGQQQNSPGEQQNYAPPHIYPWMRRMQYSQGENMYRFNLVIFINMFLYIIRLSRYVIVEYKQYEWLNAVDSMAHLPHFILSVGKIC